MISGRKLLLYLSPFIFLSPFYIDLGGAPIFYAQTLFGVFFVLYIATRLKIAKLSSNENVLFLIKFYLVAILISFFLNSVIDFSKFEPEKITSRLVSIAFLFLLIINFLAPKYIFSKLTDIKIHQRGFILGLSLLVIYYAVNYTGNSDLYLAREEINQRIPSVLVYFCWSISAAFLLRSDTDTLLKAAVFAASTTVVLFSLTRAAYIQWAISLFCFLFIFKKELSISRLSLIVGSLIVVAIFTLPLLEFASTIQDRLVMLLNPKETAYSEHSANLRISIWMAILEEISSSPIYILLGTGQLGPSYLDFSVNTLGGDVFGSTSAHSQYLDTFVRSGLVGLAIESSIILVVIAKSIQLKKLGVAPVFFGSNACALIGIFFYGIFHETLRWQMFGAYFWFYAGMVSHFNSIYAKSLHNSKVNS